MDLSVDRADCEGTRPTVLSADNRLPEKVVSSKLTPVAALVVWLSNLDDPDTDPRTYLAKPPE